MPLYKNVFKAGGDLTGTSTNQTVININGASVPLAGSLVTGNVLQVNGASSTTYGYVTNVNVDPAAAIAGTKISPDFGSQNITTTGALLLSTGTRASAGLLRFPNNAGSLIMLRDSGNTSDLAVIGVSTNGLTIGADTSGSNRLDSVSIFANTAIGNYIGTTIYTFTNATNGFTVGDGKNFSMGLTPSYGGGVGVAYVKAAATNPSSNPTNGALLYVDVADGYFKTRTKDGYVVAINGIGFTANGDLSGTSISQTVIKINGATVPAAGLLTTGHVLQVNGTSSNTYGFITDANIDPAAAITYSKLSLTGSIVNADVNASAAIAGTKISPDFGSQTIATTGPLTIGANVPTTGGIRLGNNQFIYTRDSGNTGNFPLIGLNTTNDLFIGNNSTPSAHLHLLAANGKQIDGYIGGSIVMTVAGSLNTFTNPIAIGTTPAASGSVRLPNASSISFRNSSNSGDIIGLSLSSGNDIFFGNASVNVSRFAGVNTAFNGFNTFGGGLYCIGIANAFTVPTSNPTAGIIAYVDAADGYFKTRTRDGYVIALNGNVGSSFIASGDLTGSNTSQTVSKLQSITLNASSPADGYALVYDSGTSSIIFKAAGSTGALTASDHRTLRQLIHLADIDGPTAGFVSGAYRETVGGVFPTSIIWYTASDKLNKIMSKEYTYSGSLPDTITLKVYDTDGLTVLETLVDTITYVNSIETSRIRVIS